MPARAYTNNTVVFYPTLGIGDTLITHANGLAAEAYGYASPKDLVGRYLSDLQPSRARRIGQLNHALRKLGHPVAPEYVTMVRHPDGKLAGQRRRKLSDMVGYQGQESYLTEIEVIRDPDQLAMPNLAAYGVSEETKLTHTGRFTVAKVRAMSRKQLTLRYGERVTMIIDECERVSTTYYGWPPGYGLDFFLRQDLCTGSLSDKASTLLYLRHTCEACGRRWDGKRPPGTTQCPSCKEHLERHA